MEIKGRVALVTGAASGIGKAYVIELLNQGAKVYMIFFKRKYIYINFLYFLYYQIIIIFFFLRKRQN